MDGNETDQMKTAFEGYLSLQLESYEFISRTIAMHNWLREAYQLYSNNPSLSSDELYVAWHKPFQEIYQHLFAAFLRPYRMILGPLGEVMRTQNERSTPAQAAEASMSMFDMWTQAQARFMKGFSTGVQSYNADVSKVLTSKEMPTLDDVMQVTPANLAKQIGTEEMKAFFETSEKFFGYMGESQFLFPKTLVLHLQKLAENYPKIYDYAQAYEKMVGHTWERALRRFSTEIKMESQPLEFKVFFDKLQKVLTAEFDELLRSPDYINTQNRFVELSAELVVSMRKAIEMRMEMFPFSPFVTISEMESLEKSVHSYKRRLDNLERKIAELEDRAILPTPAMPEPITQDAGG